MNLGLIIPLFSICSIPLALAQVVISPFAKNQTISEKISSIYINTVRIPTLALRCVPGVGAFLSYVIGTPIMFGAGKLLDFATSFSKAEDTSTRIDQKGLPSHTA